MTTRTQTMQTTTMPDYFANLNPTQAQSVATIEGPLLVLAGAGTGKTKVLTTRIAHILMERKAYPSQILAVTFTNKAAREMKERIEHMVGEQAEGLWIGTFHSIAARILRRHAEVLDLKPTFTIIDTDDQLRIIKQIMAEYNIDEKKTPARAISAVLQRFKDKALVPEKLTGADIPDIANGKMLLIYKDYQHRLKQLSAVDFGDLLMHNITLFTQHTDILAEYHNKFHYMLVDEYQDTNVAQYLWLRLLAQARKNLCCVGDDDQSIYGWRGAEVGNILRFERDFPGSRIVRLEQNYRSTSAILGAASAVISHNAERLGKTLWTDEDGGEKVRVTGYYNNYDEAARIADEITSLELVKRIPLKDVAVLVRAGYQTRGFEEAFLSQGIAYRVIGGLRFYERKEIRDIIAYIRLMVLNEDDLAFERIINVPKRGIGPSTMQIIYKAASEREISLMEASRMLIEEGELKAKVAKDMGQLLQSFTRWSKMRETHHHAEIVETIIEESGYKAMLESENTTEAEGRLENLKELVRALADFESLTLFLEHVSLVTDNDETNDNNMVNIMTLHGAKGLEFDAVFLPCWEEGIFPNQRALDESGNKGLEEERRLAYVGITRAKKRLYISYAGSRRVFNQTQVSLPSRFLKELPADCCEFMNASSLLNNGGRDRDSSWKLPGWQSESDDTLQKDFYEWGKDFSSFRKNTSSPAASEAGFTTGQKVFHQKFGYGKVLSVSGDHLEVAFDKAGVKKIIDRFVEKA